LGGRIKSFPDFVDFADFIDKVAESGKTAPLLLHPMRSGLIFLLNITDLNDTKRKV